MEAGGLVFSVVQLREAIAELTAGDVKLKTLGHFRAVVIGAGQWRDFGGVLHDEGGVPQLLFHRLFKVQHLQAGQAAAFEAVFGFGQAQLLHGIGQPGSVKHIVASVGVFLNGFHDGQALKRLLQIDRLAGVAELQATGGLLGGVADQLLGVVHQVLVVPVGRVELHHGELGVVAHRDTFVAVAAIDFEHAVKAANDQALEIQLRRNAQEHFLVQRVVVGLERFGIRTTGNRVQHGCFHFQEVVAHHEFAQSTHGLAACHKALTRVHIGHQVHIALAVLGFLVGHAVELVGHGAQAFGQQANASGVDRQLTGLGFEQRAFGRHDVAQIPVLERGVQVHTHVFTAHIQLDAAAARAERRILQGAEAGLAHDALEHHAAGYLGGGAQGNQLFCGLVVVGREQGFCFVFGLEVVGESNALTSGLLLAQCLELFTALLDQLVFVLRCGSGLVLVRHGVTCGFGRRNRQTSRGFGRNPPL